MLEKKDETRASHHWIHDRFVSVIFHYHQLIRVLIADTTTPKPIKKQKPSSSDSGSGGSDDDDSSDLGADSDQSL